MSTPGVQIQMGIFRCALTERLKRTMQARMFKNSDNESRLSVAGGIDVTQHDHHNVANNNSSINTVMKRYIHKRDYINESLSLTVPYRWKL